MCHICLLLDKSFPEPKQLARAYAEAQDMKDDHFEELQVKIVTKIKEQKKTPEEIRDYKNEYFDEFIKLSSERK